MIEQLFGSRTRTKLLGLFLKNEERSFFVREITRKIDEQINSVRRELANLKSLGLLSNKAKNGKLYYSTNKNSQYFTDLKNIFSKVDIIEEGESKSYLKEITKIGKIDYAALMGVFISDTKSRIDLLLVGEVDKNKLSKLIKVMEEDLKKEINYTIFNLEEFKDRKMLFDRFLMDLLDHPKEVLINNID